MSVNWTIVVAQILNFLILVWLLKRFLYGPILQAMENRQKHLEETQEAANRTSEEAEDTLQAYTTLTADLEAEKHQIISLAKSTAEEDRQEYLEHARNEVDHLKQEWIQAMRREQAAFLQQGRLLIGREACQLARTVLRELAGTELEKVIVAMFISKLHGLPPELRQQMRAARGPDSSVTRVHSSFVLDNTQRECLVDTLQQVLERPPMADFVVSDRLIAGIELDVSGYHFGWSIEDSMHDLEQSLQRFVERAIPPAEQEHD